ncbi:RNA binding (RRM/RBD/RNP motifs) family protein [Quillaja saponaria]|uniref:RNA binding (RRM/RBD/RNP motifs) family protein n=1 Tax=Quillaja saponaria TaxID=32244 RepID=A0AAD7QG77_QUISA|nr:RNA binding (RRM/RBD/RNP motifs) family protein [Quillaja saponaria]
MLTKLVDHLLQQPGKASISVNGVSFAEEQCDWSIDSEANSQAQVVTNSSTQVEEDIISFDNQRLKDPEVSRSPYIPTSPGLLHFSNHSRPYPLQNSERYDDVGVNGAPLFVDSNVSDGPRLSSSRSILNGYPEKLVSSSSSGSNRALEHSFLLQDEGKGQHIGRLGEAANSGINASLDRGESSIISNILSMDFDTWDDSLASPQNLAKLLRDKDEQPGPLKVSSSWKAQNNNQSRFSFARQENYRNKAFDVYPSVNASARLPKNHSFIQDFAERDFYTDKLGIGNGFSSSGIEESENLGSSYYGVSSSNLSAGSRTQISAPPGFSAPSRPPPPGFSSHERMDHAFDPLSGNSLLEASSFLRNSYQAPITGNIGGTGDIEFMDPAILAVGKGRLQGATNNPGLNIRSNFPPQLNSFENEARLQLMMQRSPSPHQNFRFPEIGNNYSHLGNSYDISSRFVDQSQVSNISPFAQLSLQQPRNTMLSNGQWDGWNEVQGGNSLRMAEVMRNESLGYNKFYTGYEDSKYRMPNSGDIYNRTFGI